MLNRSTEEIALNRYAAYPEPQTFPPRTQILAFINGVNCSGLCLICSHIVENPQYKIHKIWRDLNDGPCGERVGKREIIFFFIFLLDLPSSNDFSSEKPTCMFSQKLFCTKAVSLYLPDTKQSFTETRSSVSSALSLYNGNTIQLLLFTCAGPLWSWLTLFSNEEGRRSDRSLWRLYKQKMRTWIW